MIKKMEKQIDINIMKSFLTEFYKKHFHQYLQEKDKPFNSNQISITTEFEKDLKFDFEDIDYFIGEFSHRYRIDTSNFYVNLHVKAMSYELILPFTKLMLPIVGLKKWMAFKHEERVPLQVKDLLLSIETKSLNSLSIYQSNQKSDTQEKVYYYLEKAVM
jgi:hypothetical protein